MPIPLLLPLLLLLTPLLTTAHFLLNYLPARGFNEDTLPTFPCGGQDAVTTNRTLWPLTGGPIQLYLQHTQSNIQVLIALGTNPGDAFNTVLVPTTQENGPQNFCFGGVVVPAMVGGVKVVEGMNATVQVVTNGDPEGGLYNCADITFTATPLTSAQYAADCMNSTGVKTQLVPNAENVNANGTTRGSSSSSGSSAMSSAAPSTIAASPSTISAAQAAATTTVKAAGAASQATAKAVAWMIGAVGAIGGMAVL